MHFFKTSHHPIRAAFLLFSLAPLPFLTVKGQQTGKVVRLAKLQILPEQLGPYRAALREEIEAAIRLEPGVLTLNAVVDKTDSTLITVFEIYASPQAYLDHRNTPHFIKYKALTKDMVKSLQLQEAEPLVLASKASLKDAGQ